jgi:hypothetical protein
MHFPLAAPALPHHRRPPALPHHRRPLPLHTHRAQDALMDIIEVQVEIVKK